MRTCERYKRLDPPLGGSSPLSTALAQLGHQVTTPNGEAKEIKSSAALSDWIYGQLLQCLRSLLAPLPVAVTVSLALLCELY